MGIKEKVINEIEKTEIQISYVKRLLKKTLSKIKSLSVKIDDEYNEHNFYVIHSISRESKLSKECELKLIGLEQKLNALKYLVLGD